VAIVLAYAVVTNFSPFSIIAMVSVAGIGVLYAWYLVKGARRALCSEPSAEVAPQPGIRSF
jgi:hypothetical protein